MKPLFRIAACLLSVVSCTFAAYAQQAAAPNFLAGNTVLIIRHAEKPKLGSGLTAQGERRATAYIHYFQPFHDGNITATVTALYAGADSADSNRPRLTLEPLAAAMGLKLDHSIGTKDPEGLVQRLKTEPHGTVPLISWRHGQIPSLLTALGASPETLLQGGKWPDETFDWVIVLKFDKAGKLLSQSRVVETLSISSE